MNPDPFPGGAQPAPPNTPMPSPGTTPTIPIAFPTPAPTQPKDDTTDFWSPWPLPPRGNQIAVRGVGFTDEGRDGIVTTRRFRPSGLYGVVSRPGANGLRQQQQIQDTSAAASEDVKYRGGRTIRNLAYVNLYISGDIEWPAVDVDRIDGSLSAAMRDEHLNNVLLQYYNNQPISSTALASHPLVGYTPKTVTRGDIQNYIIFLRRQGFLRSFDLKNTVFNFLLPPGTVLSTDNAAANTQTFDTRDMSREPDEVDSLAGLGGYHGSVVNANGERIYYAVGVYSQRFANGTTNGIPVFREPWKNVVATLYHQLVEARTDPDVEDAVRQSSDLNADRNLGWVSDSGLEIGDIPLRANVPITSVVREVPLADRSGTVPVQLPYSNFVHGPEGPIPQPHPLPSQ
ncbi:MAG: hypothetical protein O3A00_11320 [Planctomycetota bacterium]|nr:hypothetical protein [Planctomycetota bacterium]